MVRLLTRLLVALPLMVIPPIANAAATIRVGQPAPDFAVQSLDGRRTIRLSDFRGYRVLIFTWASW